MWEDRQYNKKIIQISAVEEKKKLSRGEEWKEVEEEMVVF